MGRRLAFLNVPLSVVDGSEDGTSPALRLQLFCLIRRALRFTAGSLLFGRKKD
jgi:hypothetical protein